VQRGASRGRRNGLDKPDSRSRAMLGNAPFLPYKEGVAGSNPASPTEEEAIGKANTPRREKPSIVVESSRSAGRRGRRRRARRPARRPPSADERLLDQAPVKPDQDRARRPHLHRRAGGPRGPGDRRSPRANAKKSPFHTANRPTDADADGAGTDEPVQRRTPPTEAAPPSGDAEARSLPGTVGGGEGRRRSGKGDGCDGAARTAGPRSGRDRLLPVVRQATGPGAGELRSRRSVTLET
jgi:hypothetical protein